MPNDLVGAPLSEPATARRRAQLGVMASVAFTVVVIGSNIPAPLLPLYQERLGLSALTTSALFVMYFVALIAVFVLMSRTHLARLSWLLLPVALLIGVVGDALLSVGADSVGLLFAGRATAGLAVGLATGSAATLAVVGKGERGRTIAASGAIAGSLLGLVLAAVVGDLLPRPTELIYQAHAVLLVLAATSLSVVLWRNRAVLAVALAHLPAPQDTASVLPRPRLGRRAAAGYVLGAAGWTVGGIALGVFPSALRSGSASDSLLLGVVAGVVLLAAAWATPHLLRALGRAFTAPQALAILTVGTVLSCAGLLADALWLMILGCLFWGAAQGFCYAFGLRLLTQGLSPVMQGRRTSVYASTSYGFCGVLVLCIGGLTTAWNVDAAMVCATVAFLGWCLLAAVLGHGRWAADAAPVEEQEGPYLPTAGTEAR
ncbi:MFS transporter [Rhodococcus sp. X156]|uniref:MFS transporter n=1 Tax=Rhodococcus sp. X156 TaxID=2499145 RepID=UPI0019CF99E4|nr:MFS transporter [Rhodococcus sp. X156]